MIGYDCTGVYGDVVRVKILYNKRDSALVQFKEPQHSQTGEHIPLKTLPKGHHAPSLNPRPHFSSGEASERGHHTYTRQLSSNFCLQLL